MSWAGNEKSAWAGGGIYITSIGLLNSPYCPFSFMGCAIMQGKPMSAITSSLLTTKQAAEMLGLSPNTLNQWRNLKRGPKFIKISKSVRYSPHELESYLEQQTRECTSRKNLQTY
jgi:predicted DNA-binding transcriptional regulator AlpA